MLAYNFSAFIISKVTSMPCTTKSIEKYCFNIRMHVIDDTNVWRGGGALRTVVLTNIVLDLCKWLLHDLCNHKQIKQNNRINNNVITGKAYTLAHG